MAFELNMAELVEWFIEHPDVTWRQQLNSAATVQYAQSYQY